MSKQDMRLQHKNTELLAVYGIISDDLYVGEEWVGTIISRSRLTNKVVKAVNCHDDLMRAAELGAYKICEMMRCGDFEPNEKANFSDATDRIKAAILAASEVSNDR